MKETELWQRMSHALGPSYYRVWAAEHNLAELNGRTVESAVAAGVSCKTVWRAVWRELELSDRDR